MNDINESINDIMQNSFAYKPNGLLFVASWVDSV